ncbi:hypothetical protein ACFY2M_35205 [Streptomyces sp. NPDC001276]|uniref:hypothetical protein n=1 Tax=Streptomyces sp. NPDC001276 TaxID=3364555 RepID=UPI00367F6FB4
MVHQTLCRSGGGALDQLAAFEAGSGTDEGDKVGRHLRADLLAHVGGHLADDAAVIALQHTHGPAPALHHPSLRTEADNHVGAETPAAPQARGNSHAR